VSTDARSPVAFFANGIGDHLINLPALRALGRRFEGRLRILCQEDAPPLFFGDVPHAAAVELDFEHDGPARRFDVDRALAELRSCDLLVSLNPWHSDSVDRLLEGLAPERSLGFFDAFDERVPLDFDKHSAELAFDVVLRLAPALALEDFAGPLRLPARDLGGARRIRDEIPSALRVLAVHADTLEEKQLPRERWIEVLDRFLGRHPDFVALVVGTEDLGLDRGVHGERVVPCYGLPLGVSLALVTHADLFCGVDSCMLHAADLARVPGVGVFGSTHTAEFGFRFGPHRHVHAPTTLAELPAGPIADALEELAGEAAGRVAPRPRAALPAPEGAR